MKFLSMLMCSEIPKVDPRHQRPTAPLVMGFKNFFFYCFHNFSLPAFFVKDAYHVCAISVRQWHVEFFFKRQMATSPR